MGTDLENGNPHCVVRKGNGAGKVAVKVNERGVTKRFLA